MTTARAVEFVRHATLADESDEVVRTVRRRTLDTLAAVTAGYQVEGIDVVGEYVRTRLDGDAATLLDGDGRRRSLAGATLANATAANALDVDDGHRAVKGHPAAVVVPPALAASADAGLTVGGFLDAVFVGYELAVRAGLAIHATDGVYTGTGSWGAVGAAAAVTRCRGLSSEATAHALGTAEYHAPRTPIMRGVERPGMTKDGIGWGAYAGTVATELAETGFTGSGTVFDTDGVDVTDTLDEERHVTGGYLKPYPCCRWAHPGIDAVLTLRACHALNPTAVDRVRVYTFEEATHLDTRRPETVEAAEYSYPYPVAAALLGGRFTTAELAEAARTDESVRRLAARVELRVDDAIDARFPAECLARVEVDVGNETHASAVTRPRGSQERPLSARAQREKVETLCRPALSREEIERVRTTLRDRSAPVETLLEPWR